MMNETTNKTASEQPRSANGPGGRSGAGEATWPGGPGAAVALADAIEDATVALAGISEALEWRTAADPDPLLELLAETAATQAETLRNAAQQGM